MDQNALLSMRLQKTMHEQYYRMALGLFFKHTDKILNNEYTMSWISFQCRE